MCDLSSDTPTPTEMVHFRATSYERPEVCGVTAAQPYEPSVSPPCGQGSPRWCPRQNETNRKDLRRAASILGRATVRSSLCTAWKPKSGSMGPGQKEKTKKGLRRVVASESRRDQARVAEKQAAHQKPSKDVFAHAQRTGSRSGWCASPYWTKSQKQPTYCKPEERSGTFGNGVTSLF